MIPRRNEINRLTKAAIVSGTNMGARGDTKLKGALLVPLSLFTVDYLAILIEP